MGMLTIRTFGQLLLLVATLTAIYKAFRKWRLRRAIRRLSGKVILVTGASSGLGEALAQVFHSVGAKVILAGRNVQKLQQIKFTLDAETPGQGPIARHSPAIIELDLTEGHTLIDHTLAAIKLFGRVDILVNNAGISSRGSVLDTDCRVDRTVMETNFFGHVQITKALLPSMLEQGTGHIVVISSIQGKLGIPLRSSYAASKHALHGYFDSLRTELSHRGIFVSIICPEYINTRLSVNALQGDGRPYGVTDVTTSQGMPAEQAAYYSLEAIASKERETLIIRPLFHLALYLKFIWPAALDWILRKRAKID